MIVQEALERLRGRVLALEATGSDGFEGLVATSLADLTGLVFRLAKSGSQFGRDASSPPGLFAIAMEAKRYSDNEVSLERLAGKATVARQELGGIIDLWVVAATAEVGDATVVQLREILEDAGITPLILDWAVRPLPPLAVLLAATREETVLWFANHVGADEAAAVAGLLAVVASDVGFAAQSEALRESCGSSDVGLDALRRQASDWLNQRLRDRSLSQRAFGQFLTVNDPSQRAVRRQVALSQLSAAVDSEVPVIAVLGEEGTGKSWIVSQWWADYGDSLIPIFVAGHRRKLLDARDPMDSLACLLAEQAGSSSHVGVTGWRRRLERWSRHPHGGAQRFVLVLDGLNEEPNQPWGDIVGGHSHAVTELGGILVVTSRPHFWNMEVRSRLGPDFKVVSVVVEGYTPDELAAVLEKVGVDPAALPGRVRKFVSNPRVCAVAMHLLSSLKPAELTVERLLLEYWRHRLEERRDLLRHNIADFRQLLIRHARDWHAKPRRSFDSDEWHTRSGVVTRYGPQAAEHDLTEIEEGRFLTIVSEDPREYTFRPEVLPFALGLLIVAELRRQFTEYPEGSTELLDRLLEPILGFDATGDIIAAAVGLACLDEECPPTIRELLITTWCLLQNTGRDGIATMAAYLPLRPDAFFAVAEAVSGQRAVTGLARLGELFLAMRDHPKLVEVLPRQAAQWLTRWSREPQAVFFEPAQSNRREERERRIGAHLASLSNSETALFRSLTGETPRPPGINLHRLAASLLAGKPLSPHAAALLGWSLTTAVAPDVAGPEQELAWVTRLNRRDPAETRREIGRLVDAIEPSGAPSMHSAAALVLSLLGDSDSATRGETFWRQSVGIRWRHVERFCDTNPHDPEASICSNIKNARVAIAAISPVEVWNTMSLTVADSDLEMAAPALARFDPDPVVTLIRRVVETLHERRQVPLRQLAWHLPSVSPLLEPAQVRAMRNAFYSLLAEPNRVEARDFHWIGAELVSAQVPHLLAGQQLDLMRQLPPETPLFLLLLRGVRPLSSVELERRLAEASASGNHHALKWTLFFAHAPGHDLSETACRLVGSACGSTNEDIRRLAARLVTRHCAEIPQKRVPASDDVVGVTGQAMSASATNWGEGAGAASSRDAPNEGDATDRDLATLIEYIDDAMERALVQTAPPRISFDAAVGQVISPLSPTLRRILDRYPEKVDGWVHTLMHLSMSWYQTEAVNVGYAIASVHAARDAEAAAALFRHLGSQPSMMRVLLDGIPLEEAALFAATDGVPLHALRAAAFEDVFDDAAIERVTATAEGYGASSWLDRFVEELLNSPSAGDSARALTIAGLRQPNSQSEAVIARDHGTGFLGDVRAYARKNYQRDAWARTWLAMASSAPDGVIFWRAGVLAEGVVDIRTARILSGKTESPMVLRYGAELTERLVKAAEKRSKARKTTLFGLKAPAQDLVDALLSA